MERRLAAVLAIDVVRYSYLMGTDEAGTLKRLISWRKELVQPTITQFGGRIVRLLGDGFLAEFSKRRWGRPVHVMGYGDVNCFAATGLWFPCPESQGSSGSAPRQPSIRSFEAPGVQGPRS